MTRARTLLVPLAVYLGVALVLPALNGAWQRAEFWTHASVVILVSLGATAAFAVALTVLGSSAPTPDKRQRPG